MMTEKREPRAKPIVVSGLALRFYAHHGWDAGLLQMYVRGKIIEKGAPESRMDEHYWILAAGAHLDVDGLINHGHVGELKGKNRWSELQGMNDRQILIQRAA